MPEPDPHLVKLLRDAGDILIFTGAGISTGSGIPDFRGPQGVWKTRQPVYYQDFMTSEEARVEAWDFKLESWESFRDARPTATHRAIVELERAGKLAMVVTQNIDGLHQKAGTSRDRLIEIHGTNSEIECQTCREHSDPQEHFTQFAATRKPPLCHCGGFLKSATISFGQNLGSTLSVYPAASLPLMAVQRGVPYIIVNRGETEHDGRDGVTLRLEGDVDELFAPACLAATA